MSQGGPLVLACTNLWEDGAGKKVSAPAPAPAPPPAKLGRARAGPRHRELQPHQILPVCAATKSPPGTLSRTAPNHGTVRQASLCLAPPHGQNGEAKI